MAYVPFNNNPLGKRTGDCVIRAVSNVLNEDWERTYIDLMLEGFAMKDLPTANYVWGGYLKRWGFDRYAIPNECPKCYTVRDFCEDHPTGRYVLGTGTHAVSVINGDYYDTWDSGDEVPIYFWKRSVLEDGIQ